MCVAFHLKAQKSIRFWHSIDYRGWGLTQKNDALREIRTFVWQTNFYCRLETTTNRTGEPCRQLSTNFTKNDTFIYTLRQLIFFSSSSLCSSSSSIRDFISAMELTASLCSRLLILSLSLYLSLMLFRFITQHHKFEKFIHKNRL